LTNSPSYARLFYVICRRQICAWDNENLRVGAYYYKASVQSKIVASMIDTIRSLPCNFASVFICGHAGFSL